MKVNEDLVCDFGMYKPTSKTDRIAAFMLNITELKNGMSVTDESGTTVGKSKLAAAKAISLVVVSRNVLVAPCMIATPFIMERLEKIAWFKRHIRRLNIPTQLLLTFIIYGAMVPVGCALFPQQKVWEKRQTVKRNKNK
ncbi:tricarboxylate carrier [Cooperia oncophora]